MRPIDRSTIEGGGQEVIYLDETEQRAVSHFRVDHRQGDQLRKYYRDALDAGGGASAGFAARDWLGEGFTFTIAEYQLLRKIKPFLFEGAREDRRRHWLEFAQSSEGRYFRTR